MQTSRLDDSQAVGHADEERHHGIVEILLKDRFNMEFKASSFREVS